MSSVALRAARSAQRRKKKERRRGGRREEREGKREAGANERERGAGERVYVLVDLIYDGRLDAPREAEVGELDAEVVVDEYVRGLDVAVHVLLFVHVLQSLEQLLEYALHLDLREPVRYVQEAGAALTFARVPAERFALSVNPLRGEPVHVGRRHDDGLDESE